MAIFNKYFFNKLEINKIIKIISKGILVDLSTLGTKNVTKLNNRDGMNLKNKLETQHENYPKPYRPFM